MFALPWRLVEPLREHHKPSAMHSSILTPKKAAFCGAPDWAEEQAGGLRMLIFEHYRTGAVTSLRKVECQEFSRRSRWWVFAFHGSRCIGRRRVQTQGAPKAVKPCYAMARSVPHNLTDGEPRSMMQVQHMVGGLARYPNPRTRTVATDLELCSPTA